MSKGIEIEKIIHWRDFRLKIFLEGIFIGLLAGLVVVFFRYILEQADVLREKVYVFLNLKGFFFIVLWFLFLAVISLILGYIVKKVPMSTGSGIPQVKGILLGHLKMNWLKVIIGKFIGGVLAIGAGLSLGREGPSIQLGAAIGQGVSRMLGRLRIEEKYLITSGASAGLAAAFNAPLAGVIFALEELHKNFSPAVLMSAMAASLTADYVTQEFFGQKPIFHFQDLVVLPSKYYIYLILLGLIVGVFGTLFNFSLIKTMDFYEKQRWIPKKMLPILPLFLGGLLGFVLPYILGGGHKLIEAIGDGKIGLLMLLILVIVKFIFTMVSYGSGVPGGIFLPLLVIGALLGNIYGKVLGNIVNIEPYYINNFIILAMAAYFTAIIKAPVTGSILITEMTGSFQHLFSLIAVSMTAYIVSDLLKSRPIYEQLLDRSLVNKKGEIYDLEEKNKIILEVAISIGSELAGKRIKDVNWPSRCLLISIKRGETEIIPKGDTRLSPGDYLYVLVSEEEAAKVNKKLLDLSQENLVI